MLQKMREKGILISLILSVINWLPTLLSALLKIEWERCIRFILISLLVTGVVTLIFLILYFGMEIFGILNNMIPVAFEKGWGFGRQGAAILQCIPVIGDLCALFFQLIGGYIGVVLMVEFCVLLPLLLSLCLPIVPVLLHKKGII